MGFAELARLDARGNVEVTQSLQEVLRASRRAKTLVQQILAFSRLQEAERKPVEFAPIVQEAAQLLRSSAPASIDFQLELPRHLPRIVADPAQLHQVIMNLGTNAIQAIRPAPGVIRLRLDQFDDDARSTRACAGMEPGPWVCLTVTDSGRGISPESMEHVFEPFFTTKAPGEGSGLGLWVVHAIVKSHRGNITIDSPLGGGTTVRVLLPAHDANLPPTAEIRVEHLPLEATDAVARNATRPISLKEQAHDL